jgi:hypothetical protein
MIGPADRHKKSTNFGDVFQLDPGHEKGVPSRDTQVVNVPVDFQAVMRA